jgi:hypothetical protein
MNVVLLYDNLTSSDLEYRQRLKDYTEFHFIPISSKPDWTVCHTANLHDSLVKHVNLGFKWAFINALGHVVPNSSYMLTRCISHCEYHKTPMLSHIIARENQFPSVDPQFICLDLNKWRKAGYPKFELAKEWFPPKERPLVIRSEENYHDDYTPHWIKPDENKETFVYHQYSDHFGIDVVTAFLERGFTLLNFDDAMRKQKFYLYPNSNFDLINYFILTGKLLPVTLENRYPRLTLENTVYKEYKNLSNTVYPFNTESLVSKLSYEESVTKFDRPVDHLVCVSSGFKFLFLLNHLEFTAKTKVTFIDISVPGLDYQIFLRRHWDGNLDNLSEVFRFYQKKHPTVRFSWRNWNEWQVEIDSLIKETGVSKEELQNLWKRYMSLEVNVMQMDLLSNHNFIVNLINRDREAATYIWISNAFDMGWSRLLHGKQHTSSQFIKFLDALANYTNSNYILEAFSMIFNGDPGLQSRFNSSMNKIRSID